ncbi:hypothetical protein [Sediminivirga luteola]|uniref:LPXTG-motif cell wall-anchored protein n=1 Tax=Sediminivirga luteola TaxID=1774748 RepID=A0A8J2TZK0_9MICO|nr:hypothetical protein [Sediminivirga luteola]GGA20012.1 hypothetical protein GCM10011333_23940 [Sediminivirga luteola]
MKRTLLPAGVAIAVAGFAGAVAVPAIAAPEPSPSETTEQRPDVSLSTLEITAEALATEGLTLTLTIPEGYSFERTEFSTEDGTAVELTESGDGDVRTYTGQLSEGYTGNLNVTAVFLTPEGREHSVGTFVTVQPEEASDVSEVELSVDRAQYTVEDLAEDGVALTYSGVQPGQSVDAVSFTSGDEDLTELFQGVGGSGDETGATTLFIAELPEGWTGTITASLDVLANGEVIDTVSTTFEVVDEVTEPTQPSEAPAERALAIDPETVSIADFVDQEKGVTITATGFAEGEVVTLEVVAGPENVTGIELTEVADETGTVVYRVYGANAAQPEVYIGQYDVEVTGAEDEANGAEPLTGSFTVASATSDPGQPGSGEEENGSGGGSSLPRTGAELAGLGAGLALLLGGTATVLLTMRRSKVSADPAAL